MKITLKNKEGKELVTLGVNPGYGFRKKPETVPHLKSLHTVTYETGGYDTVSYYVPMTVQVFWLWWIFFINVHKIKLGEGRMVREMDHFKEMENHGVSCCPFCSKPIKKSEVGVTSGMEEWKGVAHSECAAKFIINTKA